MTESADDQQPVLANRPARGTRPRNRRRLIIDAATGLFHDRGYADVAMSDIAEAVAIGPSALYRHFRNKQDLLAAVIEDVVAGLEDALKSAEPSSDIAAVLARFVLDRRSVGVLWRREARHLTVEDRKRLVRIARRIGDRLAEHILDRRPTLGHKESDLLAWCALGVANSVSFHRLSMPEPGFTALLTELITVPLRARVELSTAQADKHRAAMAGRSRREMILSAATTLFAEKGYSGTSIDDIGAEVGIAGPSVYNHFPAKTDILAAAMFRGNEWLWMDFNRAVADTDDPGEALTRVVGSYQSFAVNNPHLVEVLLTEAPHLHLPDDRRVISAQRAYIDEWVQLARQLHPGWTVTQSRIRVQACQMMINEVALVPRLRTLPGGGAVLANIGSALLVVTR